MRVPANRNNGRIQFIFDKKNNSGLHCGEPPMAVARGYITWWGYFTQICTRLVGSDPSLQHCKEIGVVVRNKFCDGVCCILI